MQDAGPARPYSSQDYLNKLRQERLGRRQAPVEPPPQQAYQPSPPAPQPPEPEYRPPQPEFRPQPPENQPQPTTDQPLTPAEIEAERQRRSAFQESELFPGQFVPVPEETILEWKAPSRPFKKRNRQFYTTVAIITGLISLILFFAGQFLPIAVVIAVAFLAYVLSSVPPDDVTNKITTWGIHTEDKTYYWEEMGRFWFDDKYGQRLLQVEIGRFPGRLTLVVAGQSEDDLKQLLSEVLLNEKPKDTFYDKAAKWLQEKIPLDND
ncbi:MAG TPA: hypothetical protein VF209_03780 [Patescibacteria group bacterium]